MAGTNIAYIIAYILHLKKGASPKRTVFIMELKVNLLNEMTKYRGGYFTSTVSILDELVQNAQRAKASKIQFFFDIDKKTITVTDDGCGCSSIDALITKSQSGWDASTMIAESPAGEGMYSTAMIADTLTFSSIASCRFNFGKIFYEGSLDIIELIPETRESGVEIVISNLLEHVAIGELYEEWCRYAERNLQFVRLDISLSTKLVAKGYGNNLESKIAWLLDQSNVNKVIETENYMFLFNKSSQYLNVYYQDRLTKQMNSGFVHVGGDLIIKNSKYIDVRLPDRKDIVDNDKLRALRASIVKECYEYFRTLDKHAINEEMDSLINLIPNNMWDMIRDLTPSNPCNWIYSHKLKSTVSVDYFWKTVTGEKSILFVDTYSYNKPSDAVIANNLYNDREVWEMGRGIYNFISEVLELRLNLEPPLFKGHTKAFNIGKSMASGALVKELAVLVDYLYNEISFQLPDLRQHFSNVYIDKKPTWDIVEVEVTNRRDQFQGLCSHGDNRILLNWTIIGTGELIQTKKEARQFIINNSETILHELSHFIFKAEDKTTEHAEGMIKLYGFFINYLLK